MGLDMYFYSTTKSGIIDYESDIKFKSTGPDTTLYYHRKHNRLNGWMSRLYISKGGDPGDFNCSSMILTVVDLRQLKRDIRLNLLHNDSGFFWGNQEFDLETKKEYNDMIKDLINRINRGEVIYYHPNW